MSKAPNDAVPRKKGDESSEGGVCPYGWLIGKSGDSVSVWVFSSPNLLCILDVSYGTSYQFYGNSSSSGEFSFYQKHQNPNPNPNWEGEPNKIK